MVDIKKIQAGMDAKKLLAEERCYKFPSWVTDDMKLNFWDMWRCFRRTPVDYYDNDATLLNRTTVKAGWRNGSVLVGEYYHKWNNMGWLYVGGLVFTVHNAKAVKE